MTPAKLRSRTAFQSPAIQDLVQKLVAEVSKASAMITGPESPMTELTSGATEAMKTVGKLRGRDLFYPYVGSGLGSGAYTEVIDGSIKLDLINGIGIHILGHSHPKIIEASVKAALADITMQGNLEPNQEYMEVTRRLVEVASKGSRLRHAWLSTCGTMANENALKICRQKRNGARKIIAMESAFAGRSTMMAEITDNPGFKEGLPEYHEVLRLPFASTYSIGGCDGLCSACQGSKDSDAALAKLKEYVEKFDQDICCFTFEPMQGEGGYKVGCRKFFMPLLEFCKEKGIPVWADEVQTFCRTGEFFAYQTLGFGDYVDVCTVAKTLQTGATLYTEAMNPKPGLISGTFSGSTVSLAAGTAVLNVLDKEGYMGPTGRIQQIHKEFTGMLKKLSETTCRGMLSEIGGLGLMIAVTPLDGSKDKVSKLLQVLYKNGMITFNCGKGPYRIRFLLPAIISSQDIQKAGEILEKSLHEVANPS